MHLISSFIHLLTVCFAFGPHIRHLLPILHIQGSAVITVPPMHTPPLYQPTLCKTKTLDDVILKRVETLPTLPQVHLSSCSSSPIQASEERWTQVRWVGGCVYKSTVSLVDNGQTIKFFVFLHKIEWVCLVLRILNLDNHQHRMICWKVSEILTTIFVHD